MVEQRPALSVVLPVRNGGRFFKEALQSLAGQTWEDFEVLIQDDGSSDGSLFVADEVARFDERFRLEAGPPLGVVSAANRAAERARSDWLVRMDADDIARPERLEKLLAYAQAHPRCAYFGSRIRYFPRDSLSPGMARYEGWLNDVVTPEDIWRDRFVEYPLPHPSTAIQKDLFFRLGGYRDGAFPEDYDLFLRAAALGTRFGKHEEVLLDWREGPHRATKNDGRYSLDAFRALKVKHLLPLLEARGRPLGIVGAGRGGRALAGLLTEAGVAPHCFLDIHPGRVGQQIRGLPVHGYEKLPRLRDCFFLSAVGPRGAREEVRSLLEEAGFQEDEDFLCTQ